MLNLEELAKFLVKAKVQTYAGDGKEIKPQRPGFKELEYKEGDWDYRDSYSGFFMAPGQEIVRFRNKPVWAMAYSGGMIKDYKKLLLAKRTFSFLKEALALVPLNAPFRGPKKLTKKNWKYINSIKGDLTDFKGNEKIYHNNKLIFEQNYIGGLIINK